MENKRYDNIEYDDNWKTTSSVTAHQVNPSTYLGIQNSNMQRIGEYSNYSNNNNSRDIEKMVNYNHNRNDYYDTLENQEDYYKDIIDNNKKKVKKTLTGTQRIIKFQLIICIIIGISFFAIQIISPDLFNQILDVYRDLYNASIVITDVGNIF